MMNQDSLPAASRAIAPHIRMKILLQMAQSLEDEAEGLYRRAAVFEEEEFMLNPEIEERLTEITRLQLKLEALRSEADTMREEVFNGEGEIALAIASDRVEEDWGGPSRDDDRRNSIFFQRVNFDAKAGFHPTGEFVPGEKNGP